MIEKLFIIKDGSTMTEVREKLNEVISKLNELTQPKKWEPTGRYYYVDDTGGTNWSGWDNNETDKYRLAKGNCYPDRKSAEEALAVELKTLGLE